MRFEDDIISVFTLEHLVLFHNIAPQSRASAAMTQQLAQRFGLSDAEQHLLSQNKPLVVKRHSNPLLAQKLCEVLVSMGAISWVQCDTGRKPYEDRRGLQRRSEQDRRYERRKNKAVSERRRCSGRRRDEQALFFSGSWGAKKQQA